MKKKYGNTNIFIEVNGVLNVNTTGTSSTTVSESDQWDELEAVMDSIWAIQEGQNLISAISGSGKSLTIKRCAATNVNSIKTDYTKWSDAQTKASNFLLSFHHYGQFDPYLYSFLFYIKKAFTASSYDASSLVAEFSNRPAPWSWNHTLTGTNLVTAVSELLTVNIPGRPSTSDKATIKQKLMPFWGSETTLPQVGGPRLFNLGVDLQIALADDLDKNQGSNATIHFDPTYAASGAYSVSGSTPKKKAIVLGHELIHALRGMKGEITYGPFKPTSGTTVYELEDTFVIGLTNNKYTYTENILRNKMSVPARTAI